MVMTTITCKIPEKLDARLAAMAREQRVTKSAVVRQALEDRVKRQKTPNAPRAFDLIKRVIGTVKGPRDLSSNPKYLEDLGA
jgi:metal-responsive CopG/Arc/MetJ family transcriptional regulator